MITQAKELSEKDNAGQVLRKMADEDRQVHQLLRCMTGENFEKEHWGMLFSILKIKHVQSADKLKLGDLLASDILSKSQ